jgi:hypothetical protein
MSSNRDVISPEARALLRQMIQHEDDLRNQRLGYFLTLNGFLFASLGLAWHAGDGRAIVVVLGIAGSLISVSAYASMVLSNRAIRYLRKRDPASLDPEFVPTAGVGHDGEIASIPVAISGSLVKQGWVLKHLQPWILLPVVLGGSWIAVLIIGSALWSRN